MRALCSLFAVCFAANFCFGQEPIVEIKAAPDKSVFNNSTWDKPIVIKSGEEAAKHFGKEALETITKQVDFSKQIVLIFAWRGSGGDELEYRVLESFPEQIPFSRRRGETDDLRSHSRVFALRSNVRWSVKSPK